MQSLKNLRSAGHLAIAVTLFALVSASAADCNDKCLRKQIDAYLAAMIAHDPARLRTNGKVRFTENGTVLPLGDGLWKTATGLGGYQQFFTDAVSQQAMYYGVINEGTTPALLSLRVGVKDGRIAEAEHIVARKGSHPLFAPEAFVKPSPMLSAPIAPEKRLSREKLIEIADSYMEGIEKHDSRIIQSTDTCQRIENGVQTTNRPGRTSRHCAQSADVLTYIKSVDERRYPIVDREHGVVVSTFIFDIPGTASPTNDAAISSDPQVSARLRQPRTLLLTEWFKIDDGKIQHIEAIMHNLPQGTSSGWK